jgi:hypothetical protein
MAQKLSSKLNQFVSEMGGERQARSQKRVKSFMKRRESCVLFNIRFMLLKTINM